MTFHILVAHAHLFDTIVDQGGAVISHFPLGFAAAPYTFPQRNEIIAGLARGLIVIEAKERSGSLITAQLALEMGKDVFAIPSDISRKNSLGSQSTYSECFRKAYYFSG